MYIQNVSSEEAREASQNTGYEKKIVVQKSNKRQYYKINAKKKTIFVTADHGLIY